MNEQRSNEPADIMDDEDDLKNSNINNNNQLNDQSVEEEEEESSSSSELGDLEEDDLELIEHNLRGNRRTTNSGAFRRLVKKQQKGEEGSDWEDASGLDDDKSDNDEDQIPRLQQRKRRADDLAKLFEEDDDDVEAETQQHKQPIGAIDDEEEDEEDDLADFIEEDEEEETGHPSTHKTRPSASSRVAMAKGSRGADFDSVFGRGLSRDMLQDLLDVFGDGSDYAGMLAEEDETEEVEEANGEEQLDGNELTLFDIPERLKDRASEATPSPEELDAEAEWIAKRFIQGMSNQHQESMSKAIRAVLGFMRMDLLEVPFIATHRKEYFHDLLSLNDLWRIWDDDEQWRLFRRQRVALEKRLAPHGSSGEGILPDPRPLEVLVERADTCELQQTCLEYLQKALGPGGRVGGKVVVGSGGSASEGSIPMPIGLITPCQFAENWATGQSIHRHSFKDDGSSIDISAAALHIGLHPSSHTILRGALLSRAAISVLPTRKGLEEITSTTDDILAHELLPLRQIRGKPVSAWTEDHWVVVREGEAMGLVEVAVGFGQDHLSDLIGGSIGRAFGCGDLRNDPPTKILTEAINVHVIPRLKRQILLDLGVQAEQWIAQQAQYSLQDRLMSAPGRWSDGNRAPPVVLAVTLENLYVPGITPVLHGAVVDVNGRLIEQSRWPVTLASSTHHQHSVSLADSEEFLSLCKDLQVTTIVIAGQHPAHKALLEHLGKLASENLVLDEEDRRGRKQSKKAKSRTSEAPQCVQVVFGYDDTARMSQKSSESSTATLRYCQSLARRWLNPLGELCAAITQGGGGSFVIPAGLQPHQSSVPRDLLVRHVERALMNVINLVGVDLNEASAPPSKGNLWGRALLPWVCGLGPKAVEALVQARKRRNAAWDSRDALKAVLGAGSSVLVNCASFLRITEASLTGSQQARYDPLDDTRIHPDNYPMARKMACDALEIQPSSLADHGEAALAAVKRVMHDEPGRLDDLLLEEYAEELERQQGPPKRLLTLLDIRSELQHPYIDLRLRTASEGSADAPPATMSPDAVFAMLTGESERTLWLGQEVTVKIEGLGERSAQCQLLGNAAPTGATAKTGGFGGGGGSRKVPATIPLRNMRSLTESGRQPLHPGQALRSGQVVKAVVKDIRLEDLLVELSMRPEDMSAPLQAIPFDPYYDHTWKPPRPEASPSKGRQSTGNNHRNHPSHQAVPVEGAAKRKRTIPHPSYHPVNRMEAEAMLAATAGDGSTDRVIIRPSGSKGPDHLVLTWMVDPAVRIYQHVEIEERDRPHELALGRTLVMLGERYDDLDEIIARYVEPVSSYLQDIRSCPKYLETMPFPHHRPSSNPNQVSGEADARMAVEGLLAGQAAKQPGRICYGFWLSRDRPGHVVLSYLPGSTRVFHELVQVGPAGFQLRGRSFERLEALVNWFKLHYRDRK